MVSIRSEKQPNLPSGTPNKSKDYVSPVNLMSTLRSIDVPEQHKNSVRPKLLFLARSFPPVRVTSCVRTWNTAKYLARLGWQVTVVTPNPSVWRNVDNFEELSIQLEKEGIQRILTEHWWRFLEPEFLTCRNRDLTWVLGGACRKLARWRRFDTTVGWSKPAERACASLTPDDVDVILATGAPFSSFRLAKLLSDKLGRPYVLDYRDPWTGNPHALSRPRPKTIRQETKLLAKCAAATVVSPSWAEEIDRRFAVGPKLHVITNGYDPEELANVKPQVFGHFAIVYTGMIFYPPKRVITPVMAALKKIKEAKNRNGREWYFHYYGGEENHVREEARKFGVLDRVVLHGNVSRAEALSAVRGANVAVVITTVDEKVAVEDRGIVPGKIFEAIGLEAATLLIAPPTSDAAKILRPTGRAGIYAGTDIQGIAAFLDDRMKGRLLPAKNIQMYAWPNVAKQLDGILRASCWRGAFQA
jgi:glycosyltransferase involved in cell wall biosynthesis